MSTKLINKYTVQIKNSEKKRPSFLSLAKNHFAHKKGVEKNLSSTVDEILYGKK